MLIYCQQFSVLFQCLPIGLIECVNFVALEGEVAFVLFYLNRQVVLDLCLSLAPLDLKHAFHIAVFTSHLAQNTPLPLLQIILDGHAHGHTTRHARVRLYFFILD